MLNVILVPTDGSGFDRDAIRVATRLSDVAGAELKLVRVWSAPIVFTGPDTLDFPRDAIEREREYEMSRLNSLRNEVAADTRANVTASLQEGPIADALVRYAHDQKVDVIVISSHGRGGVARAALGSVTDSLIRNTNIPVLVVKPSGNYLGQHESGLFQRILVPLDGSTIAEDILPHVIEIAKKHSASVILQHVLIPVTFSQKRIQDRQMPWWEDDMEVAQTYLAEQAEILRKLGVPTTIEISIGESPADGITRAAGRLRADLIAIGTRGRGGLARVLRGSVADRVVRCSRTSLLVIHPAMQPEEHDAEPVRGTEDFAHAR